MGTDLPQNYVMETQILLVFYFFSMSEVTAKIPKPVLRGLHNASIKRNLAVSGVLCVISVIAFKVFYVDPKKQAYADFYK